MYFFEKFGVPNGNFPKGAEMVSVVDVFEVLLAKKILSKRLTTCQTL
jgi:hypothetical protein